MTAPCKRECYDRYYTNFSAEGLVCYYGWWVECLASTMLKTLCYLKLWLKSRLPSFQSKDRNRSKFSHWWHLVRGELSLEKRPFSHTIFRGKSFVLSRVARKMFGLHNVENPMLFEALVQDNKPFKDREPDENRQRWLLTFSLFCKFSKSGNSGF